MPRKDRLRREWEDLVASLAIGSVVNAIDLIKRLNGDWWTPVRVGSYLRIDPRFKKVDNDTGHKGYRTYEVIG